MFSIDWLKDGTVVDTETSDATVKEMAIASARRRSGEVASRLPGREPDSFRLSSAAGKAIGVYRISG